MPSLLTQCPHCLTSFRVTETQLDAAGGLVRCGACLGVFSAESNRITLKRNADGAAVDETLDADELEHQDDKADVDATAHAEDLRHSAPATEAEPRPDAGDELEDADEESDDYEFILPGDDRPSIEAAPQPRSSATAFGASAGTDGAGDEDLLDDDDIEVTLGDLNLDMSDDFASDEDYDSEEEEEEAFDEESENTEGSDTDLLGEEYDETSYDPEQDEAFADHGDDDYDDVEDDAEDNVEYDLEDAADEPPPPPARGSERVASDRAAMRQYLSRIEDDDALDPLDDDALDELDDEPLTFDSAPRRSALWAFTLLLAIVALVGVLMWQYLDENIETLSRSARFAPALPLVCRVVECPAPQRTQLDALVYEQLAVRSHPRFAQALEVTFVFRNDASVAQPFPAIELNFSDSNNRLLANRLFQPAEYVPAELERSEMPPQSSLQVTLELADPGSDAVNYSLAFRAP